MAFRTLREFIQLETSGGIVLFATALLAIVFDNSPLHYFYQALFHLPVSIQIGVFSVSKPLLLWVNDGLMTIFFLLVGLEIKREMIEGELNNAKKCVLPGAAAIGGMVLPALIYFFFNAGNTTALRGWAIPTATDIAFSLGIMALLGKRIPVTLKIFLTALAIFDDIGAIIIIAIFYTKNISITLLFVSVALAALLLILNRAKVSKIGPYMVVGVFLWLCILKSGVHATLAGIIIAFAIPIRDPENPRESPLRRVESRLHPWVAFGVLPIFAFANAGVSFFGITLKQLLSPITLGIACGLFFGKQLGIWSTAWLTIKLGMARMPKNANFLGIYGIGLIAGVGFTMSLFIGTLAFGEYGKTYPAMIRLGVIVGSLLSGILGYIILHYAYPRKAKVKAKTKATKHPHQIKKNCNKKK